MFLFRGIRHSYKLFSSWLSSAPVGRPLDGWYGQQVLDAGGEPRLFDERTQGTLEGKKATDGK